MPRLAVANHGAGQNVAIFGIARTACLSYIAVNIGLVWIAAVSP